MTSVNGGLVIAHNQLQNSFVLLARPYRETSLLIDFLTQEEGRISVIARGARRKKSNWKALLQPFISLKINAQGKRDLATLISVEQNPQTFRLTGNALLCGFYLNELLQRVLHRHDPCEEIFNAYLATLQSLTENSVEVALRRFEKTVLQELGYGLQITHEAKTHQPIEEESFYYFTPHYGCTKTTHQTDSVFIGSHLLAIAQDDFSNREMLKSAKQLMRLALQPLLGERPLKSRELWQSESLRV